jgi:hypothetical protein
VREQVRDVARELAAQGAVQALPVPGAAAA